MSTVAGAESVNVSAGISLLESGEGTVTITLIVTVAVRFCESRAVIVTV